MGAFEGHLVGRINCFGIDEEMLGMNKALRMMGMNKALRMTFRHLACLTG